MKQPESTAERIKSGKTLREAQQETTKETQNVTSKETTKETRKETPKETETTKNGVRARVGRKDSETKAGSKGDPSKGEESAEKEKTSPETPDDNDGDTPETAQEETPRDMLALERDKYLRLAAEYDNYRKRSAKEREMMYGDARADTITRLLPVYDNLERALKMECADEAFYKGVEMTMTQLTEILETMGVKQIPAMGEPFDPNLHNAVLNIEDPELGEKTVAEECQKGFMLGERVIRHSTVVVAN